MQIKLCKLHNAKQIIRDKLRKYIKKHQLSQKNAPTRPERAEAPSPGHRPGLGASALSGRMTKSFGPSARP